MKKTTAIPHDATFKAFLTNPETAREFIELHLPAEYRTVCDLNSLKLESGSFVEKSLHAFYSDVLYSLKTRTGDGYIHVLIEHQSTPDKMMAFRMMRYAVAAMQRHLEAGHRALPLVIPILFYTGKRSPYPHSTNWLQAFDDPQLAGRLYSGDFPLVDVTVIPDDEIMNHRSMAALTLIQKHIHQRDLAELLDRLATILIAGHITGQQLVTLINYITQAGEAKDAEAFLRGLAQKVPQHEEELMTIAQQLEQKGLEKGMLLGEQKGMLLGEQKGMLLGEQKGRLESKLEIAGRLLQSGMPRVSVMELTGLSDDELAQV